MHAWRSLSRCLSQPGNIAVPVCRSCPSLYRRRYSTRHESSSSTKEGSSDVPRKSLSLSETLRQMDRTPHFTTSQKEPRSPQYASLLKCTPLAPPKKKKLKRRLDPRDREKKKRRQDRREAKILLKGIEDLNKQISGLPDEVDLDDGPRQSPFAHDWKGENIFDDNPNQDDRATPPHLLKQEVIRSGVMMPLDDTLTNIPPIVQQQPVDTLAHGLDRVLFNPGVHWLQDPRSRVYNFTPWLQKVPKVNDFAFERLAGFIRSSRDEELRALALRENRPFAGSTSSLSGMLCHIYFLLSEYKDIDYSSLSQHFKNQPSSFTAGQRMPATVLLNYRAGVYAIDSYSPEYDDPDKNVLTWLGTLLENFLTRAPEDFKKFMRIGSSLLQPDENLLKQAYRYAKSKKFVMRSQLDCRDKRLPGTGVFDIKTRACVTVRMDILNFEENAGYLITNQTGMFESFEREYYDLIRSGFLKYSFQARIGDMDGVMVTYHNTERIFGFQYISLDEMDERLFGPTPGVGNKVFHHCVSLLEEIIEQASLCFPEQSVLCSFETRMPGKVLEVYVQPAHWEGPREEAPIKKLVMTLDHQSGGLPTRAVTAMRQPDHWTISYQIGRPALSVEEIRRDYNALEIRKKRTFVLPSSISTMDEGRRFWESLNFSSKLDKAESAKVFRPESFTLATALVEKYRQLSRQGRLLSQQIEEEEAGRPKIVLGRGLYEEDEDWVELWRCKDVAVEESQKVAQADRDLWASDALQASVGAEDRSKSMNLGDGIGPEVPSAENAIDR